MDAISFEYTKQRKQFGLHPSLFDSPVVVSSVDAEPVTPTPQPLDPSDSTQQYTPLTPVDTERLAVHKSSSQWFESISASVELDCIPSQAAHEVNTERYVSHAKGTSHTEGAWPSEIKTNEFVDRQRYVRRLLNEPAYAAAVVTLTKNAETVIQQNNTIDCYQQYFPERGGDGGEHGAGLTDSNNDGSNNNGSGGESYYDHLNTDFHSSPPSVKTVCVFRDPNTIKRTATKISWHPDSAHKLAVAYSITAFQSHPPDMPLFSYIWDVTAPNHPDSKLIPQSSLTTLAYNPRSPDHIVGGAYNGMIAFFDLRKGGTAIDNSLLEKSHHDPVYDVYWIQSRTGNECCSLSTDGQLLWWDVRKLKAGYSDSMYLTSDQNDIRYGGMSMEYKSDAGATRFLVGTEQGIAVLCDRKAKKDSESQKSIKSTYGVSGGQHHGPIYSIQRNPFNLKYFLTVGDWSAKLWQEDLREPILTTRYDRAYLTSGQWSTTRPGVYYTSKSDGCMDVWDLYDRQESPVFTYKVSDAAAGLTSMKVHSGGKLIALGDSGGSVNVLSVSRGLVEVQKDEKAFIASLFERETKREKALEVRKQQAKRDAGRVGAGDRGQTANGSSSLQTPAHQHRPSKAVTGTQTIDKQQSWNVASWNIHEEVHEDEETKEALKRADEDFFVCIEEKGEQPQGSTTSSTTGRNNARARQMIGHTQEYKENGLAEEKEESDQAQRDEETEEKTNQSTGPQSPSDQEEED